MVEYQEISNNVDYWSSKNHWILVIETDKNICVGINNFRILIIELLTGNWRKK